MDNPTRICRVVYRNERGQFVRDPGQAKSVVLTPEPPREPGKRYRLKRVGTVEGVRARISGDLLNSGKVARVKIYDPEIEAAKKAGGETAEGARRYERDLRRMVYQEARRRVGERFDWGAEVNRERSSRGGKNAAITKAKVRDAQAALSDKSTAEVIGLLRFGETRFIQMAAKSELKKRGIEAPKSRRRKK